MTDAQGHTIRDERDELIAALQAELDAFRSAIAGQEDWTARIRALDAAAARTYRARCALAGAPKVRRVEVVVRNADVHPGYGEIEAADPDDGLAIADGTRAVLLVPGRP